MAETPRRKLAAIMFTDLVGYTALSQRNEALAVELLEEHRRLLRPVFSRFGGNEIKTIGDAFLVEFPSAVEAVCCAIEIQKSFYERNSKASEERQILLRVGLHVGDVIFQEGDVLGDGVNIASRIEPLAQPGGICVSEDVARQIRNKIEFPTEKIGRGELKNVDLPVDIYWIVLPWGSQPETVPCRAPLLAAWGLAAKVTAGLVAFVLLAGLAMWMVRSWGGTALPASGPIGSLAVLPLQNLMGDPEQEYFVDGMTDALITQLAQLSALKVISRTSVMKYKDSGKTPREIAQELDVDALVEGSLFRSEDRVRITAQLILGATNEHLWARSYERDLRDLIVLQSEVARAIASEIQGSLTSQQEARLGASRPINPEAHDIYLRGRYYWNQRDQVALEKSIHLFEQAIAKDPEFALAYAGLADSYGLLGSTPYDVLPPRAAKPKAKGAALKALELDEMLAEAHTSLARDLLFYDWDWPTAEREFRSAIELNPSYSTARQWFAEYLQVTGKPEEALAQIRLAMEHDPNAPLVTHLALGRHYYLTQEFKQAIAVFREWIEMRPDFFLGYLDLGLALAEVKQYEEAIAAFRKAVELSGHNPISLAGLGYGYSKAGRKLEARGVIRELRQASRKRYVPALYFAGIYAGLDEKDQAFEWLERAFEERSDYLIYLGVEPTFEHLRSDPRFQSLLRRMNFPE